MSITSRSTLWSPDRFVLIYVHESAHRLLLDIGHQHDHDAAFFCLQLTLLLRLDQQAPDLPARASAWSDSARLYDVQDAPAPIAEQARAAWLPRAIGWAMATADELAPGQLTAEECAAEIASRYSRWCEELAGEPARLEAQQRAAKRRAEISAAQLAHAREQAWLRGCLAVAGLAGFLAIFVLALRFKL